MEVQETSLKEHILRTASRLFHDQGYNLTGINQIIEEAGVAKASLYHYFPSKEDLCVSYMQRRNDLWFSNLEHSLAAVSEPRQRIIGTFDYRVVHVTKNNFGGCTNIKIISELPQRSVKIDELVIRHKEKQRKFFVDLVIQLVDNKREAKSAADKIFLLFDGGTVQAQVYRNAKPLQTARQAVAEMLERY